ncbi:MAG: BLUF domain-containing protein [Erythrobacter sp.]
MMKQLIYRSRPFGFDSATLAGILSQARRNNSANDITGALVCRQDMYIQLIEGPEGAIDALFANICADDRHTDVELAVSAEVDERIFPEWDMLDDTAPSMTFSKDEVQDGAIERASPETLRAVFQRIADHARAVGG